MKAQFTKPDFNNNIVNISATLAEFLGCPNDKPILPSLAKELKKGYKNVVFMILDAMGTHPMDVNLSDDSFFKRNTKQVLTSVFPSTTTNATTTLISNKYPMEHGWFGWSLYFEGLKRAIDVLLGVDSYTREYVGKDYIKKTLPFEPFYKYAKTDYKLNMVVPEFADYTDAERHVWSSFEEMLGCIESICKREGRQFVYVYCDEPDHSMHEYGVTSEFTHELINKLNDGVEGLFERLNDTLLIITADHGQVDVSGTVEFYKDEELTSMLEWPAYLDARATAFKVKEDCRQEFERLFNQRYGEDFALFRSADMIADNYFGVNVSNDHASMLGDFIAVGKTHKTMQLSSYSSDFKGHHTSLTEEMFVPLIFVGKK